MENDCPRQADDILGMTRTCFRGFGKETDFKVDLLLFCVAIYIIDISILQIYSYETPHQ